MPRFVIDLGTVEMSTDDQLRLSTDLQKVAISHLAGLKFNEPIALKFPREWLGLIAHQTFEGLQLEEKRVTEMVGRLAR